MDFFWLLACVDCLSAEACMFVVEVLALVVVRELGVAEALVACL